MKTVPTKAEFLVSLIEYFGEFLFWFLMDDACTYSCGWGMLYTGHIHKAGRALRELTSTQGYGYRYHLAAYQLAERLHDESTL